jgi:hypothetical protein
MVTVSGIGFEVLQIALQDAVEKQQHRWRIKGIARTIKGSQARCRTITSS